MWNQKIFNFNGTPQNLMFLCAIPWCQVYEPFFFIKATVTSISYLDYVQKLKHYNNGSFLNFTKMNGGTSFGCMMVLNLIRITKYAMG